MGVFVAYEGQNMQKVDGVSLTPPTPLQRHLSELYFREW